MRKILLLILVLPFLAGADYYVRTDGHDTNCNGTANASAASAPNCAWLTITKAESALTSGTHTVNVADGEYTEDITININGTDADNLLTFQSTNKYGAVVTGNFVVSGNYVKLNNFKILKNDGQVKTIDWTGTNGVITNNYVGLKESWSPYQRVDHSRGAPSNYGICGSAGATSLTISGNYVTDGCQGIYSLGSGSTISNNEIDHLKMYYEDDGHAQCGDVDYIRLGGINATVSNNYLHGILLAEIGAGHVDGIQWTPSFGDISGTVIEKNRIFDVFNSCVFGYKTAEDQHYSNVTVRNNLCVSSGNYGFDLGGVGATFYNNTIIVAGSCFAIFSAQDTEGNVWEARNNLIICTRSTSAPALLPLTTTNAGVTSTCGSASTCSNNLFYAPSYLTRYKTSDYPTTSPNNNIVNQDPLYDSYYALQEGSPGIGAGADLSALFTTDITGATRSTWDLGAYAYGSEPDDPPPEPPVSPTTYAPWVH